MSSNSRYQQSTYDFLLSDELRWNRRKVIKQFHDRIFGPRLCQIRMLQTDKMLEEAPQLIINTFRYVPWSFRFI
jgi:hypothetical protein